ncbi:reverse transcriptase domain, reverse transcriptase zinc-binding domain protein [Tanacetum coccineum]
MLVNVKNTCPKCGLKCIQLHEEFFLFQFDTNEGMVNVMENGPWLIRRMPLILNVWTPNTILKKEEIKLAPIWANNDDMCLSSWGRSTYARVLIEVSADKDLMESMVVLIRLSNGKGHSFATIDIAYEWKLPRKKSKTKQNLKGETSKKVEEVDTPTVSKGTSNEGYEQVARKVNANKNGSKPRTDVLEKDSVVLKNTFGSLGERDTDWEDAENKLHVINDSDSESMDEELVMEEHTSMNTTSKDNTGASTPDVVGFND